MPSESECMSPLAPYTRLCTVTAWRLCYFRHFTHLCCQRCYAASGTYVSTLPTPLDCFLASASTYRKKRCDIEMRIASHAPAPSACAERGDDVGTIRNLGRPSYMSFIMLPLYTAYTRIHRFSVGILIYLNHHSMGEARSKVYRG